METTSSPVHLHCHLITMPKTTSHRFLTMLNSNLLNFSMLRPRCLQEKLTNSSTSLHHSMMASPPLCHTGSSTPQLMQLSKAKYHGTAFLSLIMVCVLNRTPPHGWMKATKSGSEAHFKSSKVKLQTWSMRTWWTLRQSGYTTKESVNTVIFCPEIGLGTKLYVVHFSHCEWTNFVDRMKLQRRRSHMVLCLLWLS